jgi:hypothetical protein
MDLRRMPADSTAQSQGQSCEHLTPAMRRKPVLAGLIHPLLLRPAHRPGGLLLEILHRLDQAGFGSNVFGNEVVPKSASR